MNNTNKNNSFIFKKFYSEKTIIDDIVFYIRKNSKSYNKTNRKHESNELYQR